MDAAGIDKTALAAHVGFPAQFGQSRFALIRGNQFEAQVKANGCAELLTLLRSTLGLSLPEVAYQDLEEVGGNTSPDVRHSRARAALSGAVRGTDDGTLIDHPLLRFEIGGRRVYLEPDLIAFQWKDQFHVVEIKSFPVIDGQADGAKVAAAAIQSAVYVVALVSATELCHDCCEPVARALNARRRHRTAVPQLVRIRSGQYSGLYGDHSDH
jgi:hypothetical protein